MQVSHMINVVNQHNYEWLHQLKIHTRKKPSPVFVEVASWFENV